MGNRIEYRDEQHKRECEYKRKWYSKNKQRVINRTKKQKVKIREWFDKLKATLKCVKCGDDHPAVIDFHHRDGSDKEVSLSYAVCKGYSMETILKEIKKCDVLCCRCHRILHWEERHSPVAEQVG